MFPQLESFAAFEGSVVAKERYKSVCVTHTLDARSHAVSLGVFLAGL